MQILCLGAHPDDIEIGCGGTVLRICEELADPIIHWVVFSAHGSREEEALEGATQFRQSAAGGQVLIHHFRDGFFPSEIGEMKEVFEDLKGRFSPELIFTHFRSDRHQDHRVVSDLTWNTWRDHTILEYEIPKWDGDLGSPNGFVPLAKNLAERKAEGIVSLFPSQEDKPWFSSDTFLGLMRLRGNECRAEEGFAEAFYAQKLVLL
jgi:LmbE family N-acetylglucosaminyl deacetylase